MFLGPTGSGKTTYIKELNAFGGIHVNFSDYIIEFANNQPKTHKEEILHMINETGILSPAIAGEVLGSLYRQEVTHNQLIFSHILQRDLFLKVFQERESMLKP